VDDDQRTGPSAETEALAHADAPQVVSLLARLSEEQRNVVALRILGDLGVEETARILDRSTGSVKQLQRRALVTMRTLMEREEVAL
jgi:RNA polymerase sigma-70 factor (ECF subfamily)